MNTISYERKFYTIEKKKVYKVDKSAKCKLFYTTSKSTKICRHPGCTKQPSFAPPGFKYLRCKEHKIEGDVNVRARKCEFDGCEITPAFGPPNQNNGYRCLKHKLDSDINVKKKYCQFKGCEITASFGPKGTRKMLRCYQHKLYDDINTKRNTKDDEEVEIKEVDEDEKNIKPIIAPSA